MKSILKLFIPLILASIFIVSCGDNEQTGNLDVNFKLKYDGEPLVMFDEYAYPDGTKLFFTRFSFYMSDVNLTQNTTSHSLSEIEMVNPTAAHQELSSAQNGYSMVFSDIPANTYDGLSYGLGVSPDLNAMSPVDFSTSHPLGSSGEYWLGWESYVSIKIEGKIDFDGDGEFEEGMSLHLGSDDIYQSTGKSSTITIQEDETTTYTLEIDLKEVFLNNSNMYDLESTPRIHSLEQLPQAQELASNLAQILKE